MDQPKALHLSRRAWLLLGALAYLAWVAKRLGVTEQDVIDMNGWLSGDASLNAPIRADSDSGEWLDWLVDEGASQEAALAASDELDDRRKALASALSVLNDRERRIFEARRLAEDPITFAELADEFGVFARARAPDRRELVREGAEGGEEPRRRDRNSGAPAGALAQPSPVVGETADGRRAPFKAAERCEKGAAHRVLMGPR
jgi:hypothetical protein